MKNIRLAPEEYTRRFLQSHLVAATSPTMFDFLDLYNGVSYRLVDGDLFCGSRSGVAGDCGLPTQHCRGGLCVFMQCTLRVVPGRPAEHFSTYAYRKVVGIAAHIIRKSRTVSISAETNNTLPFGVDYFRQITSMPEVTSTGVYIKPLTTAKIHAPLSKVRTAPCRMRP